MTHLPGLVGRIFEAGCCEREINNLISVFPEIKSQFGYFLYEEHKLGMTIRTWYVI